ncbi:hypothetical protein C0989_009002 [Termitomyces sp. Mn162]|nr:hypothetical protein C0989_009002 [Termitomyces sp. Mn162]
MAGRLIYASKSDMTTSVSYPGYLNVSIPFTTSDDDTLVAVIPRITSNTFQLPPLPYSSSLQLHSILSDIVTTSPAQWATSRPLSLQHITPKTKNTSQNQQTAVFSFTPTAATRLAEPSPVMHPNNPYVPWTSEMRREYLRPSPSYSRCVDFGASKSSSIVLLSEPIASSVNHRSSGALSKRTRLSASLRTLASTIGKNLKQVAKRMSKYNGPSLTLDTTLEPAFFPSILSSNSSESMDATTLSTWLSDRQHKQTEYEKTSTEEMTLDEYELRGSWTHLPRSSLMNVARFALFNGSHPPRKSRSESILKPWSQPASLVTRSPRVESLCLNEGDLGDTLSPGNRETRMPGGWVFG